MNETPIIQNYGTTKTFVQSNGQNHMNNIDWKLKYDGNNVYGDVDMKNDNNSKHYKINLDNNDLARLLGSQKRGEPLHRRLEQDLFYNPYNPQMREIIIPLDDLIGTNYDGTNYNGTNYDRIMPPVMPSIRNNDNDNNDLNNINVIMHHPSSSTSRRLHRLSRDSYPLNYRRMTFKKRRPSRSLGRRSLGRRKLGRRHNIRQKVYHIKMVPTRHKRMHKRRSISRKLKHKIRSPHTPLLPLTDINY
jgi:hypothetical protein